MVKENRGKTIVSDWECLKHVHSHVGWSCELRHKMSCSCACPCTDISQKHRVVEVGKDL